MNDLPRVPRRAGRTISGWLALTLTLGLIAAGMVTLVIGAGLFGLRALISPFVGGVGAPTCTVSQADDDRAMTAWLRSSLVAVAGLEVRSGCPAGAGSEPQPQVDVALDLVQPTDAALATHACTLTPIDPATRRAQDACTVQLPAGSFVLTRKAVPAGQTWITMARLP